MIFLFLPNKQDTLGLIVFRTRVAKQNNTVKTISAIRLQLCEQLKANKSKHFLYKL